MAKIELTDHTTLLAVHRALLELKSVTCPNDPAVIGSPLVASFANCVLDALIESELENGNTERADSWETWRRLDETRPEWQLVVQQLALGSNWRQMSREKRHEFVLALVSPFTVTAKQLDRLVLEGDALHL